MQFVGGDTAEDTLPLLHAFRRANKGALLAYSVEVDPATATSHPGDGTVPKDDLPHKRIIKEMIHSIDVAADFEDSLNDGGRRTWVAVKIVSQRNVYPQPLFIYVTSLIAIRLPSCPMLKPSLTCLTTSSNLVPLNPTLSRSRAVLALPI